MMNYTLLLVLLIILVSSYGHYTYMGTKESLRQNIAELQKGELKFSHENIPFYKEELTDITPVPQSEYDFIVIGAGSAGATVASRLREVNVSVLLIEAGIEEYPIMDIPRVAAALRLTENDNWNYYSESSDKYCLGFENSKCRIHRGKVMGGSSVLNNMIATRGHAVVYDEWAEITADESWSYKNMLKYLKKLENFDIKGVNFDRKYHNKNGPVRIRNSRYKTNFRKAIIEAHKELGYSEIDYNSNQKEGVSYLQLTNYNGERWSTNKAYLHPVKFRNNLYLTRNSYVQKILINNETKSAYGVRFSKFNQTIEVRAKKEVILSAGAINSAQLLMLSGIGPAQHLHDLGINVIKNSPVGDNLLDHLMYIGLNFKVNNTEYCDKVNVLDPADPAIEMYLSNRTGALASMDLEVLSYINVDDPVQNGNPNIELIFSLCRFERNPLLAESFSVAGKYKKQILADTFNHSFFSITPMIMYPKSSGKIILSSSYSIDKPKIYLNFLNDPDDIKILIKGIRAVLQLIETNAFKKFGIELYDAPLPCNDFQKNSDAYWECALRTYGTTSYHQAGTCRMGQENDKKSVVNSKLQVIGIKGLRIVDASIMPTISSGHLNIPVISIAEKISDEIKKKWGYFNSNNKLLNIPERWKLTK